MEEVLLVGVVYSDNDDVVHFHGMLTNDWQFDHFANEHFSYDTALSGRGIDRLDTENDGVNVRG